MLYTNFNKHFLFVINSLIYLPCSNQICKTIIPIRYCFSVSQCRDGGLAGHLDCINKECCCANGSEFKSSHGCYWNKYLGSECKYTADCVVENSICEKQKCVCPKNKMLYKSGRCEAPENRYLGDKCNENIECNVIQNAICNISNRCDCPEKQIFKFGICQELVPDPLITQYNNCLQNGKVLFKGNCEKFEKCEDNEIFYEETCEAISKLCIKHQYILQEDYNYNKPAVNNDIALNCTNLDTNIIATNTTIATNTAIDTNIIPINGCNCTDTKVTENEVTGVSTTLTTIAITTIVNITIFIIIIIMKRKFCPNRYRN